MRTYWDMFCLWFVDNFAGGVRRTIEYPLMERNVKHLTEINILLRIQTRKLGFIKEHELLQDLLDDKVYKELEKEYLSNQVKI